MMKIPGVPMRISVTLLITTIILLILTSAAYSETRYISDQLIVTVRTGAGNQYQILESLRSNTPIEILEETDEYVKARTKKGTVGYIRKQYVTKSTPKNILIARLEKQIADLRQQLKKLKEERDRQAEQAHSGNTKVSALSSDLKNTKAELEKVTNSFEDLKERSEGVLELTSERDLLLEDNTRISSELAVLQEENKDFHRSNMIQWFLAGGGVFLGGWLAGKVSRKKRGYSRF
jgi:SH3 domain protein